MQNKREKEVHKMIKHVSLEAVHTHTHTHTHTSKSIEINEGGNTFISHKLKKAHKNTI